MARYDMSSPLQFILQLEEHAKLMKTNPINVYAAAVEIGIYLDKRTPVPPAKVYVALPHEFKPSSLPPKDRLLWVQTMKEYRKMAKAHPNAQLDDDDDDELQDALAALGVPHKAAVIALYSSLDYNASAFYARALKRKKTGNEKVAQFLEWLAASDKNGCEPTLDNYLDWLSATLDVGSGGFRVVLAAQERDTTIHAYGNFVRIDQYEERSSQSIKPLPAPIYPQGPS